MTKCYCKLEVAKVDSAFRQQCIHLDIRVLPRYMLLYLLHDMHGCCTLIVYGCRAPGSKSLSLAKYNLLRHYTLVGLMDQLDKFFRALELLLPTYFGEASSVYRENSKLTVN